MIREIQESEYGLVRNLVEKDIGRNYFILLGLASRKKVYEKIYGEYHGGGLRSGLFKRKSGTLQFFTLGDFDLEGFVSLISTLEYEGLIGPRSYCHKFLDQGLFQSVSEGAYIAKLDRDYQMNPFEIQSRIRDIKVEDVDEIVELYKSVFKGFTPKEAMEEKLESNRGRGVCIEEDGKIISLAQTDFETKREAVIVGVATHRSYWGKGLATKCLQSLCSTLLGEGKDIYLQFDNLEAGRIYERLGFKIIDQVMHYNKV